MTESLRSRYMRSGVSFADYYGALVEHIGEETCRRLLPVQGAVARSPADWRALIEADENLNNVPLHRWDAMHDLVRMHLKVNDDFVAITGSRSWSLSDTVCTLKTAARRYAATEV